MFSVWAEQLTLALRYGHFSKWAFENARSFETCAVGERSYELFGTIREPSSNTKAGLAGLLFNATVQDDNVHDAVRLFKNVIRNLTEKDWRP